MLLTINPFEFNSPDSPILWELYSWQHIIPLIMCLGITFSLYVFPKSYAYLSKTNYFLYSLVGFQIIFMIYLRVMQAINLKAYQEAGINWTGILPFDFCALTQIFSIITVFWKNNKFFSLTIFYPLFASWLSIFIPEGQVQTNPITSIHFWEFFVAHFLSFYIYFYSYLYGKRQFDRKWIKLSALSLLIYALLMYIVNTSFGTSFIYMGKEITPGPVDFRLWLGTNFGSFVNTMFTIFVMGWGGMTLSYWLLRGLKPLYQDNGQSKLHASWIYVLINKIKVKKINQHQ
ncbi:TMEM164 family acyltransferase [Spiroplasma chrysopicola]|uniref:Uncharacterized protein n=1 Tax=Spiroplasma chrysopicola DF-1 TaxID=1276227 RepID=R4U3U0_9MOLU|nr:YwaF family protein [Spiroplasma chrysopicola]AGM25163.1 hypothetical protein SCHRY_v1c05850 [Spiroplasma chrysopicola DF-1]